MKKMKRTTIEIRRFKDNPTRATVWINGQQIHGVRSVEYEHSAGELPTLTMDLGGVRLDSVLMNIKVDELVRLQIR